MTNQNVIKKLYIRISHRKSVSHLKPFILHAMVDIPIMVTYILRNLSCFCQTYLNYFVASNVLLLKQFLSVFNFVLKTYNFYTEPLLTLTYSIVSAISNPIIISLSVAKSLQHKRPILIQKKRANILSIIVYIFELINNTFHKHVVSLTPNI